MSVDRARTLRKTMPPAEARLWNALRELKPLGYHFRRPVPLGRYYTDFACHHARLVIEVDGDTHFTDTALRRDAIRDGFIAAQGYEILRLTNTEVMQNIDGAMRLILDAVAGKALPDKGPKEPGNRRELARRVGVCGHPHP